jgi:hypothetical protein
MKDMLDHVKSLIPIGAVIIALAGFYYTTQHRLDHLEAKIVELENQDKKLRKSITKKRDR